MWLCYSVVSYNKATVECKNTDDVPVFHAHLWIMTRRIEC